MALVHDSRLVQCRRCGAKIKLSLKSAFDPCHWQKHRVRCLRRADNIVSGLKLENEKVRTARPFVRSSRTRRISSQTLIFLGMILRRFTLAQPRTRSRLSLRVRRTARQQLRPRTPTAASSSSTSAPRRPLPPAYPRCMRTPPPMHRRLLRCLRWACPSLNMADTTPPVPHQLPHHCLHRLSLHGSQSRLPPL